MLAQLNDQPFCISLPPSTLSLMGVSQVELAQPPIYLGERESPHKRRGDGNKVVAKMTEIRPELTLLRS
jgi:hypothetical protein